ncbi:hypothetical protein HPB50_014079 [Hyalomma asiaticum]|uniref:Uncharacterized protein n=1 Tax=Hyalomma asiaticum TaxID=266040 RepID=A0ACB7S7J1_HYAAI|nr:hypothetical protein HPB50_014079 [Hyalomma asiaticum]
MDASLPVSDAPCTGEQHLNGNANAGEDMRSNAEANVEDRGEVEPADIDINVEKIQAEEQRGDRQSASPARPSPSSEDSSSDTSSTDEEALRAEDHLRPSLCIDDVGIFPDDKAGGAVLKHSVVVQQRTSEQTPKSETIYEMTRKFVHHFTTLHVERERDAHGVYVCVSCSSAQRTLAEIREAIRNDREGRRVALVNATFMKLLVQLCNLDSFDTPRICAVSSEEMRKYYRTASVTEILGTATLLEDEQTQTVWKCFFGAAANDIRKKTYAVKVRTNLRTDSGGYNGVNAFHKRATKRIQPTAEANANPRTDVDSLIIANCLDAKHVIVAARVQQPETAIWRLSSRPGKELWRVPSPAARAP